MALPRAPAGAESASRDIVRGWPHRGRSRRWRGRLRGRARSAEVPLPRSPPRRGVCRLAKALERRACTIVPNPGVHPCHATFSPTRANRCAPWSGVSPELLALILQCLNDAGEVGSGPFLGLVGIAGGRRDSAEGRRPEAAAPHGGRLGRRRNG